MCLSSMVVLAGIVLVPPLNYDMNKMSGLVIGKVEINGLKIQVSFMLN